MNITMEQLKELYPTERDSSYFSVYDYGPLDKLIGEEVVNVCDDNYQGETRILYRNRENPDLWAIRTYYWGSCSGCDALQACNSWEDLLAYATKHVADLEWSTNPFELLEKYEKAEEERWRSEETTKFIAECRKALSA